MGTSWEITIWDEMEDAALADLRHEIFEMSDAFDKVYSRFIRTSLVWKIAKKAGTYEVPEDFMKMLQMYIDLYEPSEKKLNPLVGFTISDLGYDDAYSLMEKETVRPTPDLLDTVIFNVLEGHLSRFMIETKEPVLFDFGALGKGYFVDKLAVYLRSKNLERFLVNGSGDIYYFGSEPIDVGLEHPDDPSRVIGTVSMTEGSMCASGINRRMWAGHHHVIDPQVNSSTGKEILATWVIAATAALADALASCLFFVPPEKLADAGYRFEYVILNKEYKVKKSDGWKGEFF